MALKNSKEGNFEAWYRELLSASGMVDYSPVQGCIVYRPLCYSIWELIKQFIGSRLREAGYQDCYFPMFIPFSLMKKVDEHFRVFSRESVIAGEAAAVPLNDRLIIRPTSEIIMYEVFRGWIKSGKDLPLLVNQFCSVVRWETYKKNMPLIRDNEFMWQESHSVHLTEKETDLFVRMVFDIYRELFEDYLAIPVFEGFKPEHRKFAGALYTLAFEGLMPDIKSVQLATSHSLGRNFSEPMDLRLDGKALWQASNGVTTRVIGSLVMVHSDNKGLVLPPKIAPVQCAVIGSCLDIPGVRIYNDERKLGNKEKVSEHTLKGVPVIIVASRNSAVVYRRDRAEPYSIKASELGGAVPKLLAEIQDGLLRKSREFRESHYFRTDAWDEFRDVLVSKRGFAESGWCGDVDCAKRIKDQTKGSLRLINPVGSGSARCIGCSNKARFTGIFAEAY